MSKKIRKTKIVATIGPVSNNLAVIKELILSGVDIFRLNMKHGNPAKHSEVIDIIRQANEEIVGNAQILVDLPKATFREGIDLILEKTPDFTALSYLKNATEIVGLKKIVDDNKLSINIIAKIETNEALCCFASIFKEVESLMIARGDLGRSIPIEQVPFVQKEIVMACNTSNKMVIVATEMLLSMVKNIGPTRAEVSDVANAVLEGSNAVMLSEETAIGKNAVEAVRIMDKIIHEAESWQKHGHLNIFSKNNKEFKFGE